MNIHQLIPFEYRDSELYDSEEEFYKVEFYDDFGKFKKGDVFNYLTITIFGGIIASDLNDNKIYQNFKIIPVDDE